MLTPSGISLPQVHADLVLPLRDLVAGALVHEGDAPVAVDLEHAVGHAAEHLGDLARRRMGLLARPVVSLQALGHGVEGAPERDQLRAAASEVCPGRVVAVAPAFGRGHQSPHRIT